MIILSDASAGELDKGRLAELLRGAGASALAAWVRGGVPLVVQSTLGWHSTRDEGVDGYPHRFETEPAARASSTATASGGEVTVPGAATSADRAPAVGVNAGSVGNAAATSPVKRATSAADSAVDTDDAEYWKSVLTQLRVHLAKEELNEIHCDMLKQQLVRLEERQKKLKAAGSLLPEKGAPSAAAAALYSRHWNFGSRCL
jgi:hypothetical protein